MGLLLSFVDEPANHFSQTNIERGQHGLGAPVKKIPSGKHTPSLVNCKTDHCHKYNKSGLFGYLLLDFRELSVQQIHHIIGNSPLSHFGDFIDGVFFH